MAFNLSNFGIGFLAQGIDDDDTTIKLQAGQAALFPPAPAYVTVWDYTASDTPTGTLNREIVLYQAKDDETDELQSCVRGRQETIAMAFDSPGRDYAVAATITAAHFTEIWDQLAGFEPSVVSLKQFGGTGDGETDDTTAIANAIAEVVSFERSGGTILVPNGRFMASQIVIPDNQIIYFRGVGFGASQLFQLSGTEGDDFIIVAGSAQEGPRFHSLNIQGAQDGGHALFMDNVKSLTLNDIYLSGAGADHYLLRIQDCISCFYEKIRFRGNGAAGFVHFEDSNLEPQTPLTTNHWAKSWQTYNNPEGHGGTECAIKIVHSGGISIENAKLDALEAPIFLLIDRSRNINLTNVGSEFNSGELHVDYKIVDSSVISIQDSALGATQDKPDALVIENSHVINVRGGVITKKVTIDANSRGIVFDGTALRDLELSGDGAKYPNLQIRNVMRTASTLVPVDTVASNTYTNVMDLEVIRESSIVEQVGDVRTPQGKDVYTAGNTNLFISLKSAQPSAAQMAVGSACFYQTFDGEHRLRLAYRDPSGVVHDFLVGTGDPGQTEDETPPTQVQNLTATAVSDTRINLSWSAATDNVGVTGYRITRDGSTLTEVSGTSHADTGLTPNTQYTYTVAAFDFAGNVGTASSEAQATTFEEVDTQAPTNPTNLVATATGATTIELTWTASSDNIGVDHYEVWRDDAFLANAPSNSYNDSGLTPETQYAYKVLAVDAADNKSGFSLEKTATTDAAPSGDEEAPTAPTNLTATANGSNQIDLTWDAATDNVGVTAYKVYRDDIAIQTLGNVTSWSNTGLAPSTEYTYKVSACDAAGNESEFSNTDSDTTDAAAGGDPTTPFSASTLTMRSMSVNFDQEYSCVASLAEHGYFVEADSGTGTVIVDAYSPPWQDVEGGINGAQVNPRYDDRFQGMRGLYQYNNALRKTIPITLSPGDTLVIGDALRIAEAVPNVNVTFVKEPPGLDVALPQPFFEDVAAIVHVVANGSLPTEQSFRPGYAGDGVKKIWKESDLDLSWIEACTYAEPSIPLPSFSQINSNLDRLAMPFNGAHETNGNFTTHNMTWMGSHYGMAYGREKSNWISAAALKILLDYDMEDKLPTILRLVQRGIDLYSIRVTDNSSTNRCRWGRARGGIGHGTVWPMWFAGMCLGDTDMQNVWTDEVSQEINNCKPLPDAQKTYGYQQPDYEGNTHVGANHVGAIVWTHDSLQSAWNGGFNAGNGRNAAQRMTYQTCCTVHTWQYIPLFCYMVNAEVTGMENLRDNIAAGIGQHYFFDYMDSYMEYLSIYKGTGQQILWAWKPWMGSAWETYRSLGPAIFEQ